mmetsp:Transcript_42296/g.76684  ORF Transcript_42296/g.76684 Transcript_42296/m.76684 type:complete len:406 (+) Transcript_42296:137-1354(+)
MFGFVGGFLQSIGGLKFSCQLRCYPAAFADKEEMEVSNRLIMPPSALAQLSKLEVPSPMVFSVSDLDGRHKTHAGVLEFNAPEDQCYMPMWMLRQLRAEEGDILQISLVTLPKATFVRFRPASIALLRVFNPRALLENGLRNFVALTVGDSFAVSYNGQMYGIEVLETKPANAVSIFEADVKVEFAPPQGSVASRDSEAAHVQQPQQAEASPRQNAAKMVDDEEDPMPWKRRIPGGVKWTSPPFGFENLNRVHQASDRQQTLAWSEISPALDPGRQLGGTVVRGRDQRAVALKAAETRMAEQADQIEERRKQEEEEKRRQKVEQEAEAAAAAAKAAAAAARRKKVAEGGAAKSAAPGQQTMSSGGKGQKKAPAGGARSRRSWCSCFWASSVPLEGNVQQPPSTRV